MDRDIIVLSLLLSGAIIRDAYYIFFIMNRHSHTILCYTLCSDRKKILVYLSRLNRCFFLQFFINLYIVTLSHITWVYIQIYVITTPLTVFADVDLFRFLILLFFFSNHKYMCTYVSQHASIINDYESCIVVVVNYKKKKKKKKKMNSDRDRHEAIIKSY